MAMTYTPYDLALNSKFIVQFLDASLTNELNENFVGPVDPNKLKKGHPELEFQFPPRILSDNRRGTWEEGELRGTEPFSAFKTSGPREFSINATYIVIGDAIWTIERIKKNIQLARGYFARVNQINTTDNLIVRLKMWSIGGKESVTARIKAINVKYSETLIGPPETAFPLKTELTLDMALWTQGGGSGEIIINKDKKDARINIKALDPSVTTDWY